MKLIGAKLYRSILESFRPLDVFLTLQKYCREPYLGEASDHLYKKNRPFNLIETRTATPARYRLDLLFTESNYPEFTFLFSGSLIGKPEIL